MESMIITIMIAIQVYKHITPVCYVQLRLIVMNNSLSVYTIMKIITQKHKIILKTIIINKI